MTDTKTINACGLSCPQPALLTRQALSTLAGGAVQVLVDSATARDNVVRTAQIAGWQAIVKNQTDGSIQISLTK
jgi:tRNA 2-thiouridine synthesizing protein A